MQFSTSRFPELTKNSCCKGWPKRYDNRFNYVRRNMPMMEDTCKVSGCSAIEQVQWIDEKERRRSSGDA